MRKTFFIMILLCMAVLIITSCKKGDTGPAGPAGSANVMYSDWFVATPWTKDTVFGIWGFKYNKLAAGITQKILDSGVVLTYGKLLGYNQSIWPATQIAQLPINLTYQSGGTTSDTWSALPSPGNLRIRFVNDRNIYTSIAITHEFRYIIIPGGLKGGRMATPSYEEICRRYNIPE